MSESAPTATTVDNTVDEVSDTTAPTDSAGAHDAGTETDKSDPNPNSEAAKYRTKLREVEGERDSLTERLTGYQRRQCEAAVADLLEQPGDLWDLGKADPAAFFGDADELNAPELRAAAGALLDMRPGLATQKPKGRPDWGQYSGHIPGDTKASWSAVISTR